MLRPAARHLSTAARWLTAGVVLALGLVAWRLSQGPVAVEALKPGIERWLAAGADGGRAHVGAAALVWSPEAQTLGLELSDVLLVDGRGRTVLKAQSLGAGVSMPSLLLLDPAPGRVEARRFFAAVSVSPQGKYGLGYEAHGVPRRGGDLWRLLDDVTGPARRGRPLSYLRQVDLDDGVVDFRQVDGPVAWRGDVRRVRYLKTSTRLDGDVDVSVGDARLTARGGAAVGLKSAHVDAQAVNLDPARIFPTSGSTAPLSALDALVQAKGALSWASDRGVRAADVRVTAGAGQVRLNGAPEPFRAAELLAVFDPGSGRVLIQRASASAARADLDVRGQVWLVPESRSTGPARVEVSLEAPHGRLALAPGAEAQPLDGFAARGRYIPKTGRVEIDGLHAVVAGSPFQLAGVLQRPKDPKSWGVSLDGRVDGPLTPQQLVAVWPNGFDDDTRNWLHDHAIAGRLGRAAFRVRLPPGAVAPRHPLTNDQLRLSFAFDGAEISLDRNVPSIQQGRGEGLLQGGRFDLSMASATVNGLSLSEGSYQVPNLVGENRRILIQGRAAGDAGQLLGIVDKITGGAATARGFEPRRLSGRADMRFSVSRPFAVAHPRDYVVGYSGVITSATLSDAALGLPLKSPSASLEGTLDRLAAAGQVELGAYRGPLQYHASFADGRPTVQRADFNGLVDASTLGLSGPGGSTMRFAARVDSEGASGKASIKSKGFEGQSAWSLGSQGRFALQGVLDTVSMRSLGLPIGKGLPQRVPARLMLSRGPGGWTGTLDADAYSGALAMPDGPGRRVRYTAELSPTEARKIGLQPAAGGRSIPVVIETSANGDQGALSYTVGSWLGQVSWTPGPGAKAQYHWRTTFSADDLHTFGLPAAAHPRGPLTLDVSFTNAAGGWSGLAQSGPNAVRFLASSEPGGRRRLSLSGAVDGAMLSDLGLGAPGMVSGAAGVSGNLDMGPDGVHGGHLDADLQRAEVIAPFVFWKKPAGRAMALSLDFDRRPDGEIEVSSLHGQGPGFGLSGSGVWRPKAQSLLKISDARLEGAFDGSVELQADPDGERLTARARYLDARKMIQQGQPQPSGAAAGGAAVAGAQPLRIDAQMAQVRVSETGLVRNVHVVGQWGEGAQRKLEVVLSRDDGAGIVDLHLAPATGGMAIDGQVSDVGEAAAALFGAHSFKGGKATVTGLQVDGGADLRVEMSNVRLVRAPWMARILTMGSLHGASDTMNGAGIEFTRVVAPVSIRGARMTIGRARATGPAMGLTTQGVIDIDSRTVDLQGGIAPSYALNSAMGAVPVVGDLLVSKKGEGMFGLTYSARGAFAAPKISVNPFSLATPGILRRIFEGRSAAALPPEAPHAAGG